LSKTGLPTHWVSALFKKFQARYGHKFTGSIEGIELLAAEEWSQGLSGLSGTQIKKGLDTWQEPWPPSLPEFREACTGASVDWEFSTPIIFNNSQRAIIHSMELISLPGRAAFGDDPQIGTQWTSDGETWSQPRYIKAGKQGERNKRLMWLQQGPINLWRAQRFFGTSDAHLSVARLEAAIEPMVF